MLVTYYKKKVVSVLTCTISNKNKYIIISLFNMLKFKINVLIEIKPKILKIH